MYQRIRFKSTQENYRKEISGLKNNTFRKIDMDDERFQKLFEFEMGNLNNLVIIIENAKTKEYFHKFISDVTSYEGWVIISWK